MKDFVRRMVEEHATLMLRISALEGFLYNNTKSSNIPNVDFGNMCIQLKAMRNYAEALEARLINQGIIVDNGQYFEKVAHTANITATAVKVEAITDNTPTNKEANA